MYYLLSLLSKGYVKFQLMIFLFPQFVLSYNLGNLFNPQKSVSTTGVTQTSHNKHSVQIDKLLIKQNGHL